MLSREAVVAANRFGLGARPAEVASIASDPRKWLRAQIASAAEGATLPAPLRDLEPATSHTEALFRARIAAEGGDLDVVNETMARERMRPAALAEMAALFRAQVVTDAPFVERWSMFWANHFTVGARLPILGATAGGFEREAIRPHLFGRFGDMLAATVRHPAMLIYLDNVNSVGVSSPVALRFPVGMTENHAREILELHTVSRASGYGQEDVVALARILTGWTFGRTATDGCKPGHFCFIPQRHEPGTPILLGRTFWQSNMAQGEAALAMLAEHPSTARHIATKLVRHFVADDPPEGAVAALAETFASSGGDLRRLAERLIDLPEAWSADPASRKLRTPREWLIAAARLLGLDVQPGPLWQMLQAMGQAPFSAPSPAGWADRAEAWLASHALRQRLDLAYALAERSPPGPNLAVLLDAALGEAAGPATRRAVLGAESAPQALAMLLASPEFQWR
jgi:uncharacterized protein (DUF1800 family)